MPFLRTEFPEGRETAKSLQNPAQLSGLPTHFSSPAVFKSSKGVPEPIAYLKNWIRALLRNGNARGKPNISRPIVRKPSGVVLDCEGSTVVGCFQKRNISKSERSLDEVQKASGLLPLTKDNIKANIYPKDIYFRPSVRTGLYCHTGKDRLWGSFQSKRGLETSRVYLQLMTYWNSVLHKSSITARYSLLDPRPPEKTASPGGRKKNMRPSARKPNTAVKAGQHLQDIAYENQG